MGHARWTALLAATLAISSAEPLAGQDANPDQGAWPQWRGPLATGEAPAANPPVRWSETENIRWKTAIPGHGQATPVVWGDRVYVTTAIPVRGGDGRGSRRGGNRSTRSPGLQRYVVLAVDRGSGQIVREQVARVEAPHEGRHRTGSWASSSAVTDGEVLCAFFGSRGLYCYDMEGALLWERDLGDMSIRLDFGEGASPAVAGDTLVVVWDHQGESFITALDKRTGEERWRAARDEITSWATPLIVTHGTGAQVVTSGTRRVRSYDLASGALVWHGPGVTLNAIPSPVAADGMVYLTSGFRGNVLYAVDLDEAAGDVAASDAVIWSFDRDTPYVPSPLVADGILYLVKSNSGLLSAHNARTGRRHYGPVRLPGIRSIYASPVAAAGRIYVAGRAGATAVIAAGQTFRVLATNRLEEGFDASPAVAGGAIYLRGRHSLYSIATQPSGGRGHP